VPLLEVNHMQAHILSHFIKDEHPPPSFPFLGVTLSGGHTQLVQVDDYFSFTELGSTLDDAIGEAFDKCGKALGLGYPAGPRIDHLAKSGNPLAFPFPIPKVKGLHLSYSGVKTAVLNFLHNQTQKNADFIQNNLVDLCASIQHTLIQIILQKISSCVTQSGLTQIALGGGVAANSALRSQLLKLAEQNNWKAFLPPLAYTTDNAAMIGIAAYHKFITHQHGSIDQSASARLPI
jgi:N6-L-threonylcarbamoyladenine synthase